MNSALSDAHIHLFRGGFALGVDGSGINVDIVGYERLRSRFNIDRALVVGYMGEERHKTNNLDILELAAAADWIEPLAFLSPGAGPDVVTDALNAGFVGVSVYATDPASSSVAAVLGASLPVLTERRALLSLNVVPACYAQVSQALERHPDAVTLISHLGLVGLGTVPTALAQLARLADLPGVHVKASGLYALPDGAAAEILATVGEEFGWPRMLWGSDYPIVLDHTTFDEAVALPWPAHLGVDELDAVRGRTLSRLLDAVEH